jgi:hypothetical protein
MTACEVIFRLFKALVLYAVLAVIIALLFIALSGLVGLYCGIEWILLAALFVLHLVACAIGPMLWNNEREKRMK